MTEKPRGQEQMKALNQAWPEQGAEEVSGVLGGDRLIAARSRDNCQHPGENEEAMIHLREGNTREDFNCSKAPAKKDEHL